MGICEYGDMGICEYGDMGIWEYGNMGIWEYYNMFRLMFRAMAVDSSVFYCCHDPSLLVY